LTTPIPKIPTLIGSTLGFSLDCPQAISFKQKSLASLIEPNTLKINSEEDQVRIPPFPQFVYLFLLKAC
jgi:hypothetical protein